jgi:hypothetical protein
MTLTLPRWFPTNNWIRLGFAPALVFIATSVNHNYQTDFWHHLARGRVISETGTLLNEDVFTFTVAGKSFQDANWLSQLCFYHLFQVGGLDLVQVVNSLTLTAVMALLVTMAWRKSGSALLAGGLGVFAFLGLWQLLIIRPQTFSLLLFMLLYGTMEASVRRPWMLGAAPLLMALWANVHGGFPVGLFLVGCYVAAAGWDSWRADGWTGLRRSRFLAPAVCLATCVVATCVNPYGWKVYQYVGLTSSVASARRIDEWLPPGLDSLVGKVWVVSVLGVIALLSVAPQRLRTREVFLLLCFLAASCGSARMVSWWLLVATPIAARLLSECLPTFQARREQEKPTLGATLSYAGLLLVCILVLPWLAPHNPILTLTHRDHRTENDLEVVAERLRDQDNGKRIFSRFEWGEYLGWALSPRSKVFMDGRIEIFPDEVWADFDAVTRGRGDWEEILERYDVDCLLLDRSGFHADLLPQVERAPEKWERVCDAGDAVLFVRRPASGAVAAHGESRVAKQHSD